MPGLSYRSAGIDDLDFVATAIVQAERQFTDRTIYERVFGLSTEELAGVVKEMLAEDIPGSELCCSSFLLAVVGETPVGGLATWIEARGNLPSNLIRTNLLSHVLGGERWRQAQHRLALLSEIDIKRDPGTMQMEDTYVLPSYRGRGIWNAMVEHVMARCRVDHPEVEKVQTISVVENKVSNDNLLKSGFVVVKQTHSDNPEIKSLFPGTGRFLWERDLSPPPPPR
jgi:GNAT superfamily N-acetyltransferase